MIGISLANSLGNNQLVGSSENPNLLVGDNSDFAGGTTGDWAVNGSNASQQVLTTDPPAGFTHYVRVTALTVFNSNTQQAPAVENAVNYRFEGWFRVNVNSQQQIRTESIFTPVNNTVWQFLSIDTVSSGEVFNLGIYSGRFNEGSNVGDYIEATGLSLVKV